MKKKLSLPDVLAAGSPGIVIATFLFLIGDRIGIRGGNPDPFYATTFLFAGASIAVMIGLLSQIKERNNWEKLATLLSIFGLIILIIIGLIYLYEFFVANY